MSLFFLALIPKSTNWFLYTVVWCFKSLHVRINSSFLYFLNQHFFIILFTLSKNKCFIATSLQNVSHIQLNMWTYTYNALKQPCVFLTTNNESNWSIDQWIKHNYPAIDESNLIPCITSLITNYYSLKIFRVMLKTWVQFCEMLCYLYEQFLDGVNYWAGVQCRWVI